MVWGFEFREGGRGEGAWEARGEEEGHVGDGREWGGGEDQDEDAALGKERHEVDLLACRRLFVFVHHLCFFGGG